MPHTYISDISSHAGQDVELRGWVHNWPLWSELAFHE
jgi:aspartyl/asparaginyl-tRNA synthetase